MDVEGQVKEEEKSNNKIKKSVWQAGAESAGKSPLGVDTAGSASVDVLTAELTYKPTTKTGVKLDKNGKLDEISLVDTSISGKMSLIDSHVSGSYGPAKTEVGVRVGAVDSEVGFTAKVFEDGEFRPQVNVGGEITADVLKGDVSVTVGTDEYNAHVKADGTVLHGELKTEFKAGKIEKEDENGNKTVQYGMDFDAGAEAYIAQGSLSGGITVMGVKIDASVDGKIGGAGATAGASVTTGGMSGGLSLGALIGLGVNVSVDWTGFKWPWSKEEVATGGVDGPVIMSVYPLRLDNYVKTLESMSLQAIQLRKQIESIRGELAISSASAFMIKAQLNNLENQLDKENDDLSEMSAVLNEISGYYKGTEDQIVSNVH